MQRLRHIWLRVHRWIALSLGWVLILSGLTGAVLVVAQPLDRWLHPELFRAGTQAGAGAPDAALQGMLHKLKTEWPKGSFTMRPAREPGESLWVLVNGPWRGTVYFDPATGLEQGRRGETEGVVNALFKLHSSLWWQDTGKAVLAWVALAYLLLLITGLVLWWPRRWPPSWRIVLDKGLLRAFFDLHRVGGAALGLVIAVSVASGAWMAWRPLGGFVTTLSGVEPLKPPTLAKGSATAPALPLDTLVAQAQARFPGAPIGYVQVPAQADRPLRVRMRLADDPHPNGLSSVWLHPATGEVLAAHRWNELDPGARATAVIYPLHTGVLGGVLLEALIAVSGLVLAAMGVTGVWLWWKRRRPRK